MSSTGLPHYRNWTSNNDMFEPVFNAYFVVSLTPPSSLSDKYTWDLVLENLTKVGGLDFAKMMPTVKTQSFKGAKRSYVGGKVPEQFQDIELSFEVNLNNSNQMYVYNALRDWCDLAYNPMTGKMGTKKDYAGGPIIISQYTADGDVFRQVTFNKCIPTSRVAAPTEYDWENDEIFKVEGWKLRCDDPIEVTL